MTMDPKECIIEISYSRAENKFIAKCIQFPEVEAISAFPQDALEGILLEIDEHAIDANPNITSTLGRVWFHFGKWTIVKQL